MPGRLWRDRLTLGAMLLGGIALPPAFAQDSSRTVSTAFISSDLEFNDNYDLRPDSLGDATLWTTTLGFGLNARTRVDTLNLQAQGSVRVADLPVTGQDASADNPIVSLDYDRAVDDSSLRFDLQAQQADVAFFDPLSDIDDDGSFDDVSGEGTRRSLRSTLQFGFNEDGPVSLTGRLRGSDINFTDTDDPDLSDRQALSGRVDLGFRLSPILRLTSGAEYERSVTDNEANFDQTRTRADVGMSADLNQRTNLVARIGFARVESDRSQVTEIEEGLVGDVSLSFAEKTGETRISLGSGLDENGERYSFTVGRTVQWDNAQLVGDIGASTNADTDVRLIGNIDYSLRGRRNELLLGLSQTATTDDDGENVVNSSARLQYSQNLTAVSAVGLRLTAAMIRFEDDADSDSERLTVQAEYSHGLARDWDLNVGYRYRLSDTEDEAFARSNTVFFGVERSFETTR